MRKKVNAIICDMDGTAVRYPHGKFASGWDVLAEILPEKQKKEWYSLADKYYGKGNYEEWFNAQVQLLKGRKLSDAEKLLFPIPYSPGFCEFFSSSNGLKKAILSAGIDIVARKIAEEFHFDYWISQHLEIKDGIFTGGGKSLVGFDKSKQLREISSTLKVPLSATCYVGDTEGDKAKGIPRISNFMELKEIIPN